MEPFEQQIEQQPVNSDEVLHTGKEFLGHIIAGIGLTAEILPECKAQEGKELYVFPITGRDVGLLIGKEGNTLLAIQVLVRAALCKKFGGRLSVWVDVNDYRERHRQTIENSAIGIAKRVAETGKEIHLDPMPPAERRIIHMALSNNPDVETYSVGENETRAVVIAPRRMTSGSEESESVRTEG